MDSSRSLIERWSAPPSSVLGRPRQGTRWPWRQLSDELKARPGEWAQLVDEVPVRAAFDISLGTRSAFRPAGAFEAVSRAGVVYVRYVGEVQVQEEGGGRGGDV